MCFLHFVKLEAVYKAGHYLACSHMAYHTALFEEPHQQHSQAQQDRIQKTGKERGQTWPQNVASVLTDSVASIYSFYFIFLKAYMCN